MFTGLIEGLGAFIGKRSDVFSFDWPGLSEPYQLGESIAVNGCCLTVIEYDSSIFRANVVPETLRRTNLGDLTPGARVNFERPVRPSDRLGGHIVQGHIDAVGEIVRAAPELLVQFDPSFAKYIVTKGSVAIDGISLTITRADDDILGVSVIPHTASVTTLGTKGIGDRVNLEFDIVAKYVERMTNFTSNS